MRLEKVLLTSLKPAHLEREKDKDHLESSFQTCLPNENIHSSNRATTRARRGLVIDEIWFGRDGARTCGSRILVGYQRP